MGLFVFVLFAGYILWLGVVYPRVVKNMAKGRSIKELRNLPLITVIIPAFNEEHNIVSKIEDVYAQDYPVEKMLLLVVDNGSTDHTAEYAQRAGAIVLESPRGKIRAINAACAQSDNEIVVVTDADTTMERDALRRLVGAFGDPEVGAVGAWCDVTGDRSWWADSKEAYHRMDWDLRVAEGLVDTCISLDGKLMAWRLTALAGLPPKTTVDDLVVALEMKKCGRRAIIEPRAIVHERGPLTLAGELDQIRRRAAISMPPIGQYMGLMFQRDSGFYGHVIFPTRRFFAIWLPFMLIYCWLYVLALSWPVWLGATIVGSAAVAYKRAYFPFLQQCGILLAWWDFMRGNIAPSAAWERTD